MNEPNEQTIVLARNAHEMKAAQQGLLVWLDEKTVRVQKELKEAKVNLAHAKKNKWKASSFKNYVTKFLRKLEFYEKIKAAINAGYVIIPNFPLDIFAIRTKRTEPISVQDDQRWRDRDQTSERPALNEGEYKSNRPTVGSEVETIATKDPKTGITTDKQVTEYFAEDFQDVDFPFKTVKPEILSATGEALALKIFDEIGVSTKASLQRTTRGDPMVVGQIVFRQNAYNQKRVSFLIAWWVDVKDLEV